MGQSAEELKREIAETRADLSGTLDAIGDRVSPGRIIQRKKTRLSRGLQSARERVMGTAHHTRDSLVEKRDGAIDSVHDMPEMVKERTEGAPMVAGALAFGVGFLVAAAMPPSRTEKQASVMLMEKAEPLKAQLSEMGHEVADHLKEPAKDAAEQIKGAVSESVHEVAETAKEGVKATKQTATGAVEDVKGQTRS